MGGGGDEVWCGMAGLGGRNWIWGFVVGEGRVPMRVEVIV